MSDAAAPRKGGLPLAIVANLLGNVWSAVVAVLAVPLYVRFLGLEAYGLVGMFTTLQLSMALLDLGLSSTTTRELARLGALPDADDKRAELLRTLELVYFAVSVVILAILTAAARPLAEGWVRAEHLSQDTVARVFRLMAVAVAVQWPGSLYVGALLGQERQVVVATLGVVFSTSKALGVIALFVAYRASVELFFAWQAVNAAVQVALMAALVWRVLPGRFLRARFRRQALRSVWRFAAGNMGIEATGIVLSQVDKVVLSKALSLEAFGLFSLVSTVASNLSRLVAPVFTAYYPRLAALVTGGSAEATKKTYQDGAQVLSLLVAPVSVVLMLYAREALFVWTGNVTIAAEGALVLSVLVLGRLANAAMHMPAALQLAHGWTRLALYNNLVSIVLVVPAVILGVRAWGVMGAAVAWVLLNLGGGLFQVPIMHRQLMPGQATRWLVRGVIVPTLGAAIPALVLRPLVDPASGRVAQFFVLAAVTLVAMAGCAAATPLSRGWVSARLARGGVS